LIARFHLEEIMHRLLLILIAVAAIVALCGCQKEIKEIRSPQQDHPILAAAQG
jgi:hypothetical protein